MDRLDAMAVFVKAVEVGSLSAVARALGRSLPTVSRQVSALEEQLSVRLLARTTRSLTPTEEGLQFYERAKRILAEMAEAETALSARAAVPAGRLRVSCPSLIGRLRLAPLLPLFLERHPQVDVDLLLRDQPASLVEEGIDLELRIGAPADSALVARKLGEVRMLVCAAPAYLARCGAPLTPDELADHRCLVFSSETGPVHWSFGTADGDRRTVRLPSPRFRTNALDALVAAAVGGAGLVRAPSWLVAPALADGTLRPVLATYGRPPAPLHALFPPGRLMSPKVRAFLEFLAGEWAAERFDAPIPPVETPALRS